MLSKVANSNCGFPFYLAFVFPFVTEGFLIMFIKDKISFAKFTLCLMVPFTVVANYRLNISTASVDLRK